MEKFTASKYSSLLYTHLQTSAKSFYTNSIFPITTCLLNNHKQRLLEVTLNIITSCQFKRESRYTKYSISRVKRCFFHYNEKDMMALKPKYVINVCTRNTCRVQNKAKQLNDFQTEKWVGYLTQKFKELIGINVVTRIKLCNPFVEIQLNLIPKQITEKKNIFLCNFK